MAARIYYDSDADLGTLLNKTIVFVGFGIQGAAQAQNLRDSGVPNKSILIAVRQDEYADDAKGKGFRLEHDLAKAAGVADVLLLLVPDHVQAGLFNNTLAPNLKDTCTIVVASGYNAFFRLLKVKATNNLVMVAPRMIGSSVRSHYLQGKGFPCFISVEQGGTSDAWSIALAIARGIGATRAGAISSSVREETLLDLFAEQALWPNIIVLFREAFKALQEAGCSDEALCYEMWMSKEPAEIFERAADVGFVDQLKLHSICSQFGQLRGARSIDGSVIRAHFQDIIQNQILSGKFCHEFSAMEAALDSPGAENPLAALYREAQETELSKAERRVRARLASQPQG